MRPTGLENVNVAGFEDMPTPEAVQEMVPLSEAAAETVASGRAMVRSVLDRTARRLLVIVGPCSIHDPEAAMDYAQRLRALADRVRDKLKSGVVALGGVSDDKVSLLVAVTKDLTASIKAGELIKSMAVEVGGTGGGRPELAQAGGKQPEGLPRALEKVFPLVEQALGQ